MRTNDRFQAQSTTLEPVVSVQDLSIEVRTDSGWRPIVDGVSFEVRPGECLGLVGESGSGKSLTASVVMGTGRQAGARSSGKVFLAGHDLLSISERERRRLRGRVVGMIFQEPRRSLDPAFTVGDQIAEAVRAHASVSRSAAWRRAVDLLDSVGISNASRRVHDYPYMLSGGMCQRVMLAIALAGSPQLLIADEPTTALDVTVQAGVLDLLRDRQEEFGMAMLFITHDLSVVAQMCDRVAVMYAGQVVESAETADLLGTPRHPYTSALLGAIPSVEREQSRLTAIEGMAPTGGTYPNGCRFHPRCQFATELCRTGVPPLVLQDSSVVRCIRAGEVTLEGRQWQ